MHFEMKGPVNAPLIVLFGAPFCTMEPFRPLAERLEADCRVLLISWDGHHQHEITYSNARDQAVQTMAWLKEEGVTDIALIAGLSGGAKAAMEMAYMISDDPGMHLGRVLFDGFAFGNMNWLRRMARFRAVRMLQRRASRGTPEEAVTSMLSSRIARFFIKEPTPYRLTLQDFVQVSRTVSIKSTRHLVHDSCKCRLHEFPERMTRNFVFLWSKHEPSAMAARRVMRAYPQAMEQHLDEPGCLGYLHREPGRYAQLLRGLAHLDGRCS